MNATEKFEHYEVLKREDGSLFELGRGAMGITYKALDTDLECFVALKIISPSTIENKDSEQWFFREARSAAQLRHPNIASVFRLGKTAEGAHYYAMEFCEGKTLQQIIEQSGPIEPRRALQFTLQVTKALIVAEERHLVHRDLKPSNLIVTQRSDEGEVIKVIDFGLAKKTTPDDTTWSSLGTHGFIGTAHFASPEQIEDRPVDTRSDIYSLGSTLWFMLLGKPPFEGSLGRIMSQHLSAAPDFSKLHGVPDKVIALLRRMMAKNAEDRQQSALELRHEIDDCLAPPKTKCDAEIEAQQAAAASAGPVLPPPISEIVAATPPTVEPQIEEPLSEEVWMPSLLDLLRARSVLSPLEAFRIGQVLATNLDREFFQGSLRIRDIAIHFLDSPTQEQTHTRLREHATEWPEFDLIVHSSDEEAAMVTMDAFQTMTIVPGGDAIGDRVQQLARLLYELLGGIGGPRYVPVARLGEEGNGVLQRATNLGMAGYPHACALIEKLREATAGVSGFGSEHSSQGSQAHASNAPLAVSVSEAKMLPEPAPAVQASAKTPVKRGSESLDGPPPPLTVPIPNPARKNQPPRFGLALKVVAAVIGVLMIYNGVRTFRSGLSKSNTVAQKEATPQPQFQTHAVAPEAREVTAAPAAPAPTAPAAADLAPTATATVQFTIFDDLGDGQISESVWVYLDDKTEPETVLNLTRQQTHGAAVIKLPLGGHHVFSVKTESVAIDLQKGTKKIVSTGRWENDFRGGEQFDLSATPQENSDSYLLQVTPRN